MAKRMERMSIARLAGSTILISTCRSPPYDRSDYSILVKVARPARAKLLRPAGDEDQSVDRLNLKTIWSPSGGAQGTRDW